MAKPTSASDFYGLSITTEMQKAAQEGLTDLSIEGLVRAHLVINYAYFGAIDKTLSGFFVLGSEGDNYTLLDVRNGGQVFWQDHETREIDLQFDSLQDWLAFRAELEKAGDDADEEQIRKAYRPSAKKPKGQKKLTTPELADRYQWLVWLLAQPLMLHGNPTQKNDELVLSAMRHLRRIWPEPEAREKAFRAELAALGDDPHLAIYWLLHTSMLALESDRARVVEVLRKKKQPRLVDAFVEAFGALPLAGDVPIVPGFRIRRSLAVSFLSAQGTEDDRVKASLVALEIAPDAISLARATWIGMGLEKGVLKDPEVLQVVSRIPSAEPGVEAVRAMLDKRAGKALSPHADALAGALARGESDEAWFVGFDALWNVYELVTDLPALASAVGRYLQRDGFHRRILTMALEVQKKSGQEPFGTTAELEAKRALAEASIPILQLLHSSPKDLEKIVSKIDGAELRRVVARRLAQRAELEKPDPLVISWALGDLLGSTDSDRDELVASAFAALDARAQEKVLGDLGASIDNANHPLVKVMLGILGDKAEPDSADFAASYASEHMKEAILQKLAPFAHEPGVFDALLDIVERPGPKTTVDPVWGKLFNPFEKKTFILPKLDAAQATRAAKAMVACRLSHPSIHARNAAGHQLYRFNHQGAEPYLLEALVHYGDLYAKRETGRTFDHDETEDDLLEDVMANLYSAVRNMGTPASRTALIQRLFTERRDYWRMGNALGEIFSPAVHAEALAALDAKKDGHAAGCYAYAIHDFQKTSPPAVDLLERIVSWPVPGEVIARRFFRYALHVGIEAALAKKSFDLVRRAHALAASIAEAPLEPDDHSRGRGWDDPLDKDEGLKKALAAAVAGEADTLTKKLKDEGEAARKAGKPRLKITDGDLGALAGADVERRVFHDRKSGEVWFLDRDGAFHFFDGFTVCEPRFRAKRVKHEPVKDLLTGVTGLTERAIFWNASGSSFGELLRWGDRLFYHWGVNNGAHEGLFCSFPSDAEAAHAFARLRQSLGRELTESPSPFYLEGKGAIMRTYYRPKKEDDDESGKVMLWVHDGAIGFRGKPFATDEEAIVEHQKRELTWLRDEGAVFGGVEWSDRRRARRDMTVAEWLVDRIRDDNRDAAWHVRALTEIKDYLAAHGLAQHTPKLVVELGPPAEDDELESLRKAHVQPIPDSLVSLWKEIGWAQWKLGDKSMRLLSPTELLTRRPVARVLGGKMKPPLEGLDVLVERSGGEPATVWIDAAREDGRVFTHVGDRQLWWEKSLSWMLATQFLRELELALVETAPILTQVFGDQVLGDNIVRHQLVKKDPKTGSEKFWELLVDERNRMLSTRYGKVGTPGASSAKRLPDAARVKKEVVRLVASKEREGYRKA